MKTYGWTPDFVRKGITGAQGWVYYNWAMENEQVGFGPLVERTGDGYVAQQKKQILSRG